MLLLLVINVKFVRSIISLRYKKRDWEGLERKLSTGFPLEEAARNAGIPLSECYLYIKEKEKEQKTLDFELKKAGQEALKVALTKLTELAKGRRRVSDVTEKMESTDLIAARELARTALAVLKISTGKVTKEDSGQKDLFDQPGADPWELKDVE